MSTVVRNLAEQLVQLPSEDRAYLAEHLLASLEETEVHEQWMAEAKLRKDEVRSGRVTPVPADEVYRRIDALLHR